MKPAITIIFMFLLVGPQFLNASPVPQGDSYEKTFQVFHGDPFRAQLDSYENTFQTFHSRPDSYENTGTTYNGDPYQKNINYQG